MTSVTRLLIIGFAAAIVALPAPADPPGEAVEARAGGTTVGSDQVLRVRPWNLLQHDGSQLYQELCASCHGADAAGGGPAATGLAVMPPSLTHLRRAGVPREHWTYVIEAGCEDSHHWAPDGSETMPCWKRIFRQSLGNDAAPLLVSRKLVDYLESVQQ